MRSSYIENDYGLLIENYIKAFAPYQCVELGVLDGYSTYHIARGIKWMERYRGSKPQFDAYDLFDDYQYKHGQMEEVKSMLDEKGLSSYVNLQKGDAYKVHENYPDITFDSEGDPGRGIEFMHIDISNTGKVIHDIMELWHPKLGGRAVVLIEGGSDERDNIEWMKKYSMPSIKDEITNSPLISKYYQYGTYFSFPSMTMLFKKWRKGQFV